MTVVIPIFNAYGALERCLLSVLKYTPENVRILILDDGSSESFEDSEAYQHVQDPRVSLVTHETNRGYTQTANHALDLEAGRDVVLLNSDTEVGPLWLQRLRWVAYSRDDVATVSAVSDNAGHASIPAPRKLNDWHTGQPWESVGRQVGQGMPVWGQAWPTAAGFCLYVRRDAVDRIGVFDDVHFPRGYGEEADFAQRALNSGMVNLLAPHVMVKHDRSQSFGSSARQALVRESIPILEKAYPNRKAQLTEWSTSVGSHLIRIVAERLHAQRLDDHLAQREARIRVSTGVRWLRPPAIEIRIVDVNPDQSEYLVDTRTFTRVTAGALNWWMRSLLARGVEKVVVDQEPTAERVKPLVNVAQTWCVPIKTIQAL